MPSLPLLGAVTPPLAAAVLSQICYKEDLISSLPRPGLSPSRLLCILTLRFGENTEAVVFNHVRVHSRCPKQPSSSSRAAPPQRHRYPGMQNWTCLCSPCTPPLKGHGLLRPQWPLTALSSPSLRSEAVIIADGAAAACGPAALQVVGQGYRERGPGWKAGGLSGSSYLPPRSVPLALHQPL